MSFKNYVYENSSCRMCEIKNTKLFTIYILKGFLLDAIRQSVEGIQIVLGAGNNKMHACLAM